MASGPHRGRAGTSLPLETEPLSKDLWMGCCKGCRMGIDISVLQRETDRLLNGLDQWYLSHFNPKFIPGPRYSLLLSHIRYYDLYASSMLKWKPKAPDNVLSSSEVASMFSEIICTSGFLSSLRYLFAHQCHPCLHCDILTDTQTSSKKWSWVFIVFLLFWHYIIWSAWLE